MKEPDDRIRRAVRVPKKASAQDAQLLVQLCRVRSEEEMRQAHSWWRNRFWPKNVADYLKVETALGARENIDFSKW